MSTFEEALYELDYATESLSSDTKSTNRASGKALRMAKKAAKAGNYTDAIKYCDDALRDAENIKARLREAAESQTDKDKIKGTIKYLVVNYVKANIAAMASAAVVSYVGGTAVGYRTVKKGGTVAQGEQNARDFGYGVGLGAKMGKAGAYIKTMVNFIKAVDKKEDASLRELENAIDITIKAIQAKKAEYSSMAHGDNKDARESAAINEFNTGIIVGLLEAGNGNSVLESLINCGLDDIDACEIFVEGCQEGVFEVE